MFQQPAGVSEDACAFIGRTEAQITISMGKRLRFYLSLGDLSQKINGKMEYNEDHGDHSV